MLSILKQFSEKLLSPDQLIRKRYATFMDLLASDRSCHVLLAEIETIFYGAQPVDISRLRQLLTEFSSHVAELIVCLHTLAPGQYRHLDAYYKKIDFYARFGLAPPKIISTPPYVLPLRWLYNEDLKVGGKGLHLSELAGKLALPVPPGFIVSTSGWNRFVEYNGLRPVIERELAAIDVTSPACLEDVSGKITENLQQAEMPPDVCSELAVAVEALAGESGISQFAVRSSAVAEDSALSFAGQYRSLLKVAKEDVIAAYRLVLESKYTPEALLYRIRNGLDDEATPMAVLVLAMVDAAVSGVITTKNPDDPSRQVLRLHTVKGLGDKLMSGETSPETIEIALTSGKPSVPAENLDATRIGLSREQIIKLAVWAKEIEDYYSVPQEIEWSFDGEKLYMLQARALQCREVEEERHVPDFEGLEEIFSGGETASLGMSSGSLFVLRETSRLEDVPHGSVLFTDITPPSLVTILERVNGVVARLGSVADHFSSVAREFGVPVLVKTGLTAESLPEGELISLWADGCKLLRGGVELPEKRNTGKGAFRSTPVGRAMKMVVDFISPLSLKDPGADDFRPEGCRSLHDIIRFAHEKSVQAMFLHNPDSFFRKPAALRLITEIPLQVLIIDVGGGIAVRGRDGKVTTDQISSTPFVAFWRGLSHENVNWRDHSHYDWKSYDAIALAGGIAGKDDSALASYCLLACEYLNINIRFGYHFTLLDSFCGDTPEENYILLRFAGGGGDTHGKDLRLTFIRRVLEKLNFTCEQSGELLDARLMRYGKEETAMRLEQIGCLLGAVRLLDMVLRDENEIAGMVAKFFSGVYDFSNT